MILERPNAMFLLEDQNFNCFGAFIGGIPLAEFVVDGNGGVYQSGMEFVRRRIEVDAVENIRRPARKRQRECHRQGLPHRRVRAHYCCS